MAEASGPREAILRFATMRNARSRVRRPIAAENEIVFDFARTERGLALHGPRGRGCIALEGRHQPPLWTVLAPDQGETSLQEPAIDVLLQLGRAPRLSTRDRRPRATVGESWN
jgi:hypothetical protein